MDLEITLPSSAENIAPIFITSPANHSGGALLQRAVCSSADGICYGDSLFDEILSLVEWAIPLVERHQNAKSIETEILEDALKREPRTWMPELAPGHANHLSAIFSVIYNIPFTAQEFATLNNKKVWMVARASILASRMGDLLSIFPSSKSIFIYRNPLDMVRDALRDNHEIDIGGMCETWNLMMRDYLTMSSDRLLKLRYEDAIDNSKDFILSLENFTGVSNVQTGIVQVNCESEMDMDFELDGNLVSEIKSACEDMLTVYYPELTL